MKSHEIPLKIRRSLQEWAKIIAMQVRNSMEDFHGKHLSDAQMKELNPIIRNAIYQSLRDLWMVGHGTEKQKFLGAMQIHFLQLLLPDYWEPPQLEKNKLNDEKAFLERYFDSGDGPCLSTKESIECFRAFIRDHLGVFKTPA